MKTYEWLKEKEACREALRWVRGQPDTRPKVLVAACKDGGRLLWLIEHLGYTKRQRGKAVRAIFLKRLRKFSSTRRGAVLATISQRTHMKDFYARLRRSGMEKGRALTSSEEFSWTQLQRLAYASTWCEAHDIRRIFLEMLWAVPGRRERAQLADDIRDVLPDIAERWQQKVRQWERRQR